MNTLDIFSILSKDPYCKKHFLGVFPSDKLPQYLPYHCSFVVNADKSTLPGSHWFSVHKRGRECYVFDSFGRLPRFLHNYCLKHSLTVTYNSVAHQKNNEITCGGFCVYVLCELARGKTFKSIVKTFLQTKYDDAFIRSYLRLHHKYRLDSY